MSVLLLLLFFNIFNILSVFLRENFFSSISTGSVFGKRIQALQVNILMTSFH